MSTPAPFAELRAQLPELMLRDEHRLRRRLDGARRSRDKQQTAERIAADVETALLRVQQRRESVPKIEYPAELPVSRLKDEIGDAIRDHQVVIVAGETGSGKTTQLPKICLELGRGVRGQIGHTQPRRLAARTVADRIASELKTELGDTVGYKVRFTDQSGQDTLVKLMTDGILLAEIQTDRMLRQYDTLIIDEAHERSLNIDFILGYLKQLLPRRPDLKVIITSATIDPERFSRHFADAPIVEVSGRTYPVEVRYRPLADPDEPEGDPDRDQTQAIAEAVRELSGEGPGDILVFLSGEREIRDTADVLNRLELPNTEVLPLYARLSAADQHRVFQRHTGRRVVLATNVAETSLTVPGIKYVIDPGTARISRYSHRTKVQRLPIEAVSQASANQRKGRCGRTSDGICIRLYSEEDFESRPEFTDPEILRTNLASVILQMTSLGLGDMNAFPFVEPPDRRQVTDGVQLLQELGAFETGDSSKLTEVGRKLALLPVDPRMGRMVLEAAQNGCVREVMIIAAALSIQDPRERPAEKQQAADAQHARFADPTSDFLSYLKLWEYVSEQQKTLTGNQFRRMCRTEYLNYLRIREWQDIFGQLRQLAKPLGITLATTPAEPQHVHTALISGLLSHIGLKDPAKGDYLGARGARFSVFPGSALFKKQPRWVMSAELVETSRLWGRVNARIEPEWVEPLAQHVVKRSYSEPHWERKQGAVMATEKVTLYGVPLVADRRVNYGRIDPEISRAMFIRHALVEGDWHTNHRFFAENRALLDEVEDLENRARRRDILVDDQTLYEFYDARVPEDIVSVRHFDSWWKKTRRTEPDLLSFEKSMLINEIAGAVRESDYPDSWTQGTHVFKLTYQFEPGADADGVTVHIPLPVLNQVTPDGFDWQVPGLRGELATQLIKSLPKTLRRNFVPAPDTAADALTRMSPSDGPLPDILGDELHAMRGIDIPHSAWDLSAVPDHLRITFRVVDERGKRVAEGKDLDELKRRLAPRVRETISKAANSIEKAGLVQPSFGELPKVFASTRRGHDVKAYPALVDEGASVAVRLLDTPAEQHHAMWSGTRRMLRLNLNSPMKFITRSLSNSSKLVLNRNPHGSVAGLLEDCVDCAVDALMAAAGGPAWDEAGFAALLEKVRAGLNPKVLEVLTEVERILRAAIDVETRLADTRGPAESLADIRRQLDGLVHKGFVTETGADRLPNVVRYLRGIERRLEKLPLEQTRDLQRMADVAWITKEYEDAVATLPPGTSSPALAEVRWMIEELRVSFFAQTLGTARPVSLKRITKALDEALA
ncbi:ATP-dependent RNA helicase HrpA [Amycolatopsis rubida]|uniref:ATP-dependent RNA helicase HrpA n=1 Tax=Amycolatopsis rubida TaxID=112413 RepID=A0ABX0BPT9_9PSEU|nr:MULTISPECIES: ATP-dependent RNA helicase HrpA [Amycolatopsis]MYW89891.1 ATP-dependent RNA helicase HrpA [Amycolatopsis rubida]NEC54868.1 ATP-dependent RNA helicase HrpA [Amycolatopsis rubida]OAP25142.1 ATP-dependent RNA helicase HrpB [Amycolatopsis sp. M39]